jgi:hypothetical protein
VLQREGLILSVFRVRTRMLAQSALRGIFQKLRPLLEPPPAPPKP